MPERERPSVEKVPVEETPAGIPVPVRQAVVIDRRPVEDAPPPVQDAEYVRKVPVHEATATWADYLDAVVRFHDVVTRLGGPDQEDIRTGVEWRRGEMGAMQLRALVALGRLLGFEIDVSRFAGYEGGSPDEGTPHVVTPEKQQQTARDLADSLGVPVRLLVDGVRHGHVPVPVAEAERLAAVYKALRDGEPPPPGADAAEVSFAKQAVETFGRDNEQRRAWSEEHKEALRPIKAKNMRDFRERQRMEKERGSSRQP